MITVAGDYCPLCGTELDRVTVEERERRHCPNCDQIVWQNSKPVASVVVRDGDEVLLGKRAVDPNRGYWGVPGGNLEYDEHPADGVVRELHEETGLHVSPDDLTLFRVDHAMTGDRRTSGDRAIVAVRYVVDRAQVEGVPEPRDETAAVRFDTLDGFRSDGGINPWDEAQLEALVE